MIPLTPSTLKATEFVTPSSRYADSSVFVYGESGIITFETYKRRTFVPTEADRFDIVPPGEEFRPDKTSFRAYGTVDFWWSIMEANNIKDIFNYKAGTNIRIPSFITVFSTT